MSGIKRAGEGSQGDVSKRTKLSTHSSSKAGSKPTKDQAEKRDSKFSKKYSDKKPAKSSSAPSQNAFPSRRAEDPNAYLITRTKKLWERLRLKSKVPKEEREKLVAELYEIITGRVRDFVFKHDSVRVIQTALKYANTEQRKAIALELKGTYQELAQSKYGKFLLAKLVVHGNSEIRNMIIPEFYGSVKKTMKHPEASWLLDDMYRIAATSSQRNSLLREWYGPEFALFSPTQTTAELSKILEDAPEKRGPIMQNLLELITALVQKKSTGFTMLHDAMLQYFLNTKPGSAEASSFLELLKDDEDGNLVKNLAFTKSGSRLMCLALAYSNAKDRKLLLRMYRGMMSMLAEDIHGRCVILTAYEVIDDTKLTAKMIFPELFYESLDETERNNALLEKMNNNSQRIPLLYLFGGDKLSWLLTDTDQAILEEVYGVRSETSKKEPAIRRSELISAASPQMLQFITATADSLVETASGCRCITEVLFNADGDKGPALAAVANTVKSKPESMGTSGVGRMFKSLVQGGRYNPSEQSVEKVKNPLGFHSLLYANINQDIMSWATGPNPFVIVAMVESSDFDSHDELMKTLRRNKKALQLLVTPEEAAGDGKTDSSNANSVAASLLLKAIGETPS